MTNEQQSQVAQVSKGFLTIAMIVYLPAAALATLFVPLVLLSLVGLLSPNAEFRTATVLFVIYGLSLPLVLGGSVIASRCLFRRMRFVSAILILGLPVPLLFICRPFLHWYLTHSFR
jgi:hypothetical protein